MIAVTVAHLRTSRLTRAASITTTIGDDQVIVGACLEEIPGEPLDVVGCAFSPARARELAQTIMEAADEVDRQRAGARRH